MTSKAYSTAGWLTLLVWVGSLTLPAFEHGSQAGDDRRYLLGGAEYLLWRWYDVYAGTGLAWLANPILCFNVGCLISGRAPPAWLAFVCPAFAATALIPFFGGQYDDSLQGPLVARIGIFVWLAAALIPALAMVAGAVKRSTAPS